MKGEKYILAIAIDKYSERSFQSLNNAKLDTKRLINVLVARYGFKTLRKPLFDKNATRRSIIEALNESMSSLTQDDSLVIYHAGHGILHPLSKKGYWIPYDASQTVGDWIIHGEIKEYIGGCNAKHILLIDDSCFSGAFFNQTRAAAGVFNHYDKLSSEKSRWILTSGRMEKVSDGPQNSGSPFANTLLDFLENNTEQYFSTSELSVHVAKQTGSNVNQQPLWGQIENVGHAGGEMVFELITQKSHRVKKKSWDDNLLLFKESKLSRPEWPFISRVNPDTRELGIWCQDQRNNKRKGTLTKEQEKKLINAGFVFDPLIEKFYSGFTKFLVFMHKTGLNDVPARLINQYKSEDAWHRQQQKWYAKAPCNPDNPKSYPKYRFDILVKAGIPLESTYKEEAWNQFRTDIEKYYETHPRLISLPSQTDPDKKIANLGKRANDWMVQWKKNKLSDNRIRFIEQYIDKDYNENKIKRAFNQQIEAYLKFRNEFPDENPPSELRKRTDIKNIIDWKAQINHRLRKGTLPIHKWKIEQLNKVNFPWSNQKRKRTTPQLELKL